MQITYEYMHFVLRMNMHYESIPALHNVQRANLGFKKCVCCCKWSLSDYQRSHKTCVSVASCGVELPKYDPTARYVYSVDIGGVNEQWNTWLRWFRTPWRCGAPHWFHRTTNITEMTQWTWIFINVKIIMNIHYKQIAVDPALRCVTCTSKSWIQQAVCRCRTSCMDYAGWKWCYGSMNINEIICKVKMNTQYDMYIKHTVCYAWICWLFNFASPWCWYHVKPNR